MWLRVGSQAGIGSRIHSRSRMSRYGITVVFAGLSCSPGVAASRIVSYEAAVDVAAAYAIIHLRMPPGLRCHIAAHDATITQTAGMPSGLSGDFERPSCPPLPGRRLGSFEEVQGSQDRFGAIHLLHHERDVLLTPCVVLGEQECVQLLVRAHLQAPLGHERPDRELPAEQNAPIAKVPVDGVDQIRRRLQGELPDGAALLLMAWA